MLVLLVCLLFRQVLCGCDLPGLCTDTAQVQDEIVNLHNELRRGVSPSAQDMLKMSWSEEVAASAQSWVDGCSLGHGPPSTRTLDGYEMGENLFYSSSRESWTSVINTWHSEVQHYQYPSGATNGGEVGHYTQVIWNGSYRVGCGVALCPNNTYFYICHYFRAGNYRTWPPYTAGPWCGLCPDACDNNLCTNPCPHINLFLNCPALKEAHGCTPLISQACPASCSCPTEIIPVYRR